VQSLAREEFWLGLYQLAGSQEPGDGWSRWASGCDSSFRAWQAGEPNDCNEGSCSSSSLSEDCAVSEGNHWFDARCDDRIRCLCEWPSVSTNEYRGSFPPFPFVPRPMPPCSPLALSPSPPPLPSPQPPPPPAQALPLSGGGPATRADSPASSDDGIPMFSIAVFSVIGVLSLLGCGVVVLLLKRLLRMYRSPRRVGVHHNVIAAQDKQRELEAAKVALSNLPVHSYKCRTTCSGGSSAVADTEADTECAVCMERFADGDIVRRLPCLHCFHQACIDAWLLKTSTSRVCPLCKMDPFNPPSSPSSSAIERWPAADLQLTPLDDGLPATPSSLDTQLTPTMFRGGRGVAREQPFRS